MRLLLQDKFRFLVLIGSNNRYYGSFHEIKQVGKIFICHVFCVVIVRI